jgi:hypothetical protein
MPGIVEHRTISCAVAMAFASIVAGGSPDKAPISPLRDRVPAGDT